MGQQGEPDRGRVHAVPAQRRDEDQVSARLGHLLPVQRDHPGVHVGPCVRVAATGHLGVRGAHLVVREGQVAAAALDVELHAQVLQRDRHALDVPAGPAVAELGVPGGLVRAGGEPEQGVQRVLLARAVRVAAALAEDRQHLLPGQPGDLAEVRVGLDREVDVAVQLVRGATGQQLLDQRDDPRDRLDGADVVRRGQHPQRGHVLPEQRGLALGQHRPVLAGGDRALEQRVVHVGHVLHVQDVVTGVLPDPLHQVEGVVGGGVTQVGGVVGGDPADVQAGGRALRHDLPDAARGGVVDSEGKPLTRQGGYLGGGPGMHGSDSNLAII